MMYSFFVPGIPKGQPRVKAYARAGRAGVYDPGTANDWKMAVRMAGREQRPPDPILAPVELCLNFIFPRPKSHLRTNGLVRDAAPILHAQKPDIDNAIKAVMDALTDDGWWGDDTQIWRIAAERQWVRGGTFHLAKPGVHIQILVA